MRHLVGVLGQSLVVEGARPVRVQPQVELVLPAEFEARLGNGVVAQLGAGHALAQVRRVGGDLVGDDAFLDVVPVGQAQVLLGRHVAEHGGAVPADHGGADGAADVVVARGNIQGQRAQGIERRLVAMLDLLVHVFLDHVHGHMAGAFDHYLHVVLPGDLGELAQGAQLGELGLVVGVGHGAGAQAITEAEGHVVGLHDLADVLEMGVEETLLVVGQAPLGHDRAAPRDNAGDALGGHRYIAQQHAGVDGEVVHALLGLLDQGVAVNLPGQVLGHAVDLLQGLVNRHGADRHRRVAQNPLAGFVDVLAGGEVHHRVAAPAGGPGHLGNLFLD